MNWGNHMAGLLETKPTGRTSASLKCVLCGIVLAGGIDEDEKRGVCSDCKDRPEAKRLGVRSVLTVGSGGGQAPAREFTDAERSLIRKVHGYMQPAQLLAILNERLVCDLGPDAAPYTMEQLHGEIGVSVAVGTKGSGDWASLRRVLAQARRDGVLSLITDQVVQDFAVVFQLNAKQVMSIKDIVLSSREED
jgi:hypothetical protein